MVVLVLVLVLGLGFHVVSKMLMEMDRFNFDLRRANRSVYVTGWSVLLGVYVVGWAFFTGPESSCGGSQHFFGFGPSTVWHPHI